MLNSQKAENSRFKGRKRYNFEEKLFFMTLHQVLIVSMKNNMTEFGRKRARANKNECALIFVCPGPFFGQIRPFEDSAFWVFGLLSIRSFKFSAYLSFGLLNFRPICLSAFWVFGLFVFRPFDFSALFFRPFEFSAFWVSAFWGTIILKFTKKVALFWSEILIF